MKLKSIILGLIVSGLSMSATAADYKSLGKEKTYTMENDRTEFSVTAQKPSKEYHRFLKNLSFSGEMSEVVHEYLLNQLFTGNQRLGVLTYDREADKVTLKNKKTTLTCTVNACELNTAGARDRKTGRIVRITRGEGGSWSSIFSNEQIRIAFDETAFETLFSETGLCDLEFFPGYKSGNSICFMNL